MPFWPADGGMQARTPAVRLPTPVHGVDSRRGRLRSGGLVAEAVFEAGHDHAFVVVPVGDGLGTALALLDEEAV